MPSASAQFQTSRLRGLICIAAVSIALLTTCSIQAQQNPNAAPGFRSDGVYDFSGIDDVSIFNGALSSQNRHPMKFTGHERDFNQAGEGDDLDFMHARHCDPRKGRFLSVDPVRGSPGIPQSWNGYAYVQSNPLKYVDPDGRERAQILLDNDIRDLQNGKIDAERYWERVRARGEGTLLGVAVIETGIAISGAIASGLLLRRAFKAAINGPKAAPEVLNITGKQFSKKLNRRARDLGIDVSSAKDRFSFKRRIQRAFDNADDIRSGTFRGQGPDGTEGPVVFCKRGQDVVVTTPTGDFITFLPGGASNKRFLAGAAIP